MPYTLTSIIEVRESSASSITGIARQPMFPLDRIRIEEKTYEVREMTSEGMKEGTVRFVATRVS